MHEGPSVRDVDFEHGGRDKQRLDSDREMKGDPMDDSRSLRGCSELTLFARFLKKFVLRTPRWQNRNTDQRLVRIGLQI
jgi:hypothetical protein